MMMRAGSSTGIEGEDLGKLRAKEVPRPESS